jgi:RNA polymerase sigma factor for flagellar operon FliA
MQSKSASSERCTPAQVLCLWEKYHDNGDRAARDRLVLTFAPLVKYLAYRRARMLPAHVRVDELISSGLEALVRSLERYDPAKGATLQHFLGTRIDGAMMDEMRQQDWAPRSLRSTEREVRDVRRDFRAAHARQPSDAEVSATIGMTEEKLRAHRQDVRAMGSVASLNVAVSDDDGASLELGDLLVAHDGDPQAAAFSDADSEALAAAVATLPTRERTVIGLLYAQEMTLTEIGQILSVSQSRVCQIHGQAKRRLHEQLANGALAANYLA